MRIRRDRAAHDVLSARAMKTNRRFADAVNSLLLVAPLLVGCAADDSVVTDLVLDDKSDTVGTLVQLSPHNPRAYLQYQCENADGCVYAVGVRLYQTQGCAFFPAEVCGSEDPNLSRTLGKVNVQAFTAADQPIETFETPLVVTPQAAETSLATIVASGPSGGQALYTIEQDQNIVWPANVTPVRAWAALVQARSLRPQKFVERPAAAIPDNAAAGASSAITVEDERPYLRVGVDVEITHPRVGDLILKLHHPGGSVTLRERVASDWTNLHTSFMPTEVQGSSREGTWRLEVIDAATGATGRLERWSLAIY